MSQPQAPVAKKPGTVRREDPSSAEALKARVQELQAMLAKLDDHAKVLARERERVTTELARLLGKLNLHANAAGSGAGIPGAGPELSKEQKKTAIQAQREGRGKCAAMCIEDIEAVAKLWSSAVSCVALGDSCALLLYDNAEPAWSPKFPAQCPQLYEQLTARPPDQPRPVYVAIGTEDRFYIRFADGKQEWIASEDCTADIKAKPVSRVTFGRDWEDYFVIYKDGSCKFAGAPPKLAAKLQALTPKSPAVSSVVLGPEGEWFVSFADNAWEMGGCSDPLGDKIGELIKTGAQVKLITFGVNDAWIIRYNKPASSKKAAAAPAPGAPEGGGSRPAQ